MFIFCGVGQKTRFFVFFTATGMLLKNELNWAIASPKVLFDVIGVTNEISALEVQQMLRMKRFR